MQSEHVKVWQKTKPLMGNMSLFNMLPQEVKDILDLNQSKTIIVCVSLQSDTSLEKISLQFCHLFKCSWSPVPNHCFVYNRGSAITATGCMKGDCVKVVCICKATTYK